MTSINLRLIIYKSRFSRSACRFVCRYNINTQNNLINTNLNKCVPLATNRTLNQFSNSSFTYKIKRNYCNSVVDSVTFEKVCEETLESLCEYFEELVETTPHLNTADVTYSSGVLTINFGTPYGTYVINRQSPNHQIWLSSPVSGPKRYDFVPNSKHWIYKHDSTTIHQLLQKEIKDIVKKDINFFKCSYSLS